VGGGGNGRYLDFVVQQSLICGEDVKNPGQFKRDISIPAFLLSGGISENLIGIGQGIRSGLAVTGGAMGEFSAFIIDR
jgi:hypothetical protein